MKTIRQTQKDNVPLVGLPIFPQRNTMADSEYNNTNNITSFTYACRNGTGYWLKSLTLNLNPGPILRKRLQSAPILCQLQVSAYASHFAFNCVQIRIKINLSNFFGTLSS